MDEEFKAKLNAKLADYRAWLAGRNIASVRLIQYCGIECLGGIDIPLNEVEIRLKALISEAFYVDWKERNECLYLRVWEFDGPEPHWESVMLEKHL